MLPEPSDPSFPIELKKKRLELKLNIYQLHIKSGLSRNSLNGYEGYKNNPFIIPRMKAWLVLNQALGFKMNEHIEDIPNAKISKFDPQAIKIQPIERFGVRTHWQPGTCYSVSLH